MWTTNKKIYTDAPKVGEQPYTFRVLQYNVNQSVECEKHEDTKWGVRADRVRALILDVDADVVCLQELRYLSADYPSTEEWLASIKGYRFVVDYRNSQPLSFGQAILYKPERFYAKQHVKHWLSDMPTVPSDTFSEGFGFIVSGLELMRVDPATRLLVPGAQPVWVFNTHFGLDEELKTKSCFALRDIVQSIVGAKHFVVCGDFNFFPDRNGPEQRLLLLNHGWQDAGQGALTKLGFKPTEGTFVGYHYDAFKADTHNMVSRLDHIFCSPTLMAFEPRLWNKRMVPGAEQDESFEVDSRDYPSDHWPLLVTVYCKK